MRLLQLSVPYDVVMKSKDPLQSLAVLSAIAVCHPALVDDGGLKGRLFAKDEYGFMANGFAINKMLPFNYQASDLDNYKGAERQGLLLIAKDATTLLKGLRHLAKTNGGSAAYAVEAMERVGLAIYAGRYDDRGLKDTKVVAALSMATGNAWQAAVRGFLYTMTVIDRAVMGRWYERFKMKVVHSKVREFLGFDHFTSLDDLVGRVGRDGRLVKKCAVVYICPSAAMPNGSRFSNGKVEPQIQHRLSLDEIHSKAQTLFYK